MHIICQNLSQSVIIWLRKLQLAVSETQHADILAHKADDAYQS